MSLLHNEAPSHMNATAGSKGFQNKPYKSSAIMASSFYDGGFSARNNDSEATVSFKIRSSKGYKPDISAMKNKKSTIGMTEDYPKEMSPIKGSKATTLGMSPNSKLFRSSNLEQRPITEQTNRTGAS
jgi:hypothetical protein